ncbi:MAG: carbon-nitrogen family hydrolase [Paenibacillaceae bacterium]
MNKQRLHVCLLQIEIQIGQPEENYRKVSEQLHIAISGTAKPDVILLPEMWNTGYALEHIVQLADQYGVRTKKLIADFSRRHEVYVIAGSIADMADGEVRNTTYVFDRTGAVIADYSKIHLFRLMNEEKHLAAGDHVGLFELEGVSAGMMICYDIRFPELTRKLALDGVKVVFIPAEWPNPRLHHWRTLLMARAIENQMYIVACNRVGTSEGTEFFGHSLIIDPWGEIIAEAGEEESLVTAVLDLDLVDQVRQRIPVFEDRRPQFYE